MWWGVVGYGVVWCGVVWCGVVWCPLRGMGETAVVNGDGREQGARERRQVQCLEGRRERG